MIACLAVGMATLACSVGLAQTATEYRVTWLLYPNGVGPVFNPLEHGTMGINNKGQVVYGYAPSQSYVQAWAWLPEADYGMPQGWNDIGNASGAPAANIARDINDAGIIVGQGGATNTAIKVGTELYGEGVVVVWTLGNPATATTYNGLEGSGVGKWAGAHAINNQSPAVVAGSSSISRPCMWRWDRKPRAIPLRLPLDPGKPSRDG